MKNNKKDNIVNNKTKSIFEKSDNKFKQNQIILEKYNKLVSKIIIKLSHRKKKRGEIYASCSN